MVRKAVSWDRNLALCPLPLQPLAPCPPPLTWPPAATYLWSGSGSGACSIWWFWPGPEPGLELEPELNPDLGLGLRPELLEIPCLCTVFPVPPLHHVVTSVLPPHCAISSALSCTGQSLLYLPVHYAISPELPILPCTARSPLGWDWSHRQSLRCSSACSCTMTVLHPHVECREKIVLDLSKYSTFGDPTRRRLKASVMTLRGYF